MIDDEFKGAATEAYGRVQDAAGGLAGDEKLQLQGKANEAKGAVQRALGDAKHKAEEAVHQAKDKAQDALGELEAYVSAKPLLAVGLGVGFGVVLGVLLAGGGRTIYVNSTRHWPRG